MIGGLQGSLLYSRALWVSESIIAWNVYVGNGSCYLLASKTAALSLTSDGILGKDFTNSYSVVNHNYFKSKNQV